MGKLSLKHSLRGDCVWRRSCDIVRLYHMEPVLSWRVGGIFPGEAAVEMRSVPGRQLNKPSNEHWPESGGPSLQAQLSSTIQLCDSMHTIFPLCCTPLSFQILLPTLPLPLPLPSSILLIFPLNYYSNHPYPVSLAPDLLFSISGPLPEAHSQALITT